MALGEPVEFDPFDEIVTKNLHGVDLNAELVDITRLSLWLKTARNKHRLQNLEATIKVGNSLIDDPAFTDKPFDWRAAFADVFAQGGFDVVVGNPPYVRMELIKPVKPYLEEHYVVADDRTDLYAYFFERGVGVLKSGGRLGYISSSTFFRTGSGENLRNFLGDNVAIEAVIDFGDLQLFEGVTTYPAIITLRKGKAADDGALAFLKVARGVAQGPRCANLPPRRRPCRARGSARAPGNSRTTSWRGCAKKSSRARRRWARFMGRRSTASKPGSTTPSSSTRKRATGWSSKTGNRQSCSSRSCAARTSSAGASNRRDCFSSTRREARSISSDYPAIRDWLLPFKPELEKRATKQEWWELQQAQLAYQPAFSKPKVIWPQFMNKPEFSIRP